MSVSHHGDIPFEERQSELLKRFQQQQEGTAQRQWPNGRINSDDDGELAFAIGPGDKAETIVVNFGKPVEWVGMPPDQAIQLAQLLIKHARAISKDPVRIVIE